MVSGVRDPSLTLFFYGFRSVLLTQSQVSLTFLLRVLDKISFTCCVSETMAAGTTVIGVTWAYHEGSRNNPLHIYLTLELTDIHFFYKVYNYFHETHSLYN